MSEIEGLPIDEEKALDALEEFLSLILDKTELALEATGYYANPIDASTPMEGDNFQPVGPEYANGVAQHYFNTRKVSIFAESNEIQRNIMSKLVLGL